MNCFHGFLLTFDETQVKSQDWNAIELDAVPIKIFCLPCGVLPVGPDSQHGHYKYFFGDKATRV
jgi:hypothetical protein